MNTVQSITVVEDVTLISLQDSPADITLISKIFEMISGAGIDVDMISQTPPHRNMPDLSLTISGEDMGKVLEISAKLRELNPDLKLSISNGHCKISVFGEGMRGCPGVACKVFNAMANAKADISMITTSEVDISVLVAKADLENTLEELHKVFG